MFAECRSIVKGSFTELDLLWNLAEFSEFGEIWRNLSEFNGVYWNWREFGGIVRI